MKLFENERAKMIKSDDFNMIFNKLNGNTLTWGKTTEEDPDYCKFGNLIADVEISTICNGLGKPCPMCYKSNSSNGKYMPLDKFKKVMDAFPTTLTQVAFGNGDIESNPDMYKIFEYCRSKGVASNITINGYGLTDEIAQKLKKYCGAVAVSRYEPSDTCYNAVKKLTDLGMKQINIHMLLSEDNYDNCMELLDDKLNDPRLSKLNAIVFLLLKPQGRAKKMKTMKDRKKIKALIDKALNNNISIGFDSCFAPIFLECMQGHKDYKKYEMLAEPCESGLFSIYVDVEGKVYPCSFLEDKDHGGMDITKCDFQKDIWNGEYMKKWRKKLLDTKKGNICRHCPEYDLY